MTVGRLEIGKDYELKLRQVKKIAQIKNLPDTVKFLLDFFLSSKDDFFKALNDERVDPVFKDFAKKYPMLVAKLPLFLQSKEKDQT